MIEGKLRLPGLYVTVYFDPLVKPNVNLHEIYSKINGNGNWTSSKVLGIDVIVWSDSIDLPSKVHKRLLWEDFQYTQMKLYSGVEYTPLTVFLDT